MLKLKNAHGEIKWTKEFGSHSVILWSPIQARSYLRPLDINWFDHRNQTCGHDHQSYWIDLFKRIRITIHNSTKCRPHKRVK